MPTIPTTLSLRTLNRLIKFLSKKKLDQITLLPFFSMVDRRKSLHRSILEQLPEQIEGMLATSIPNASEVERMGLHRAPLGSFSDGGPALAYDRLWHEIKARLRNNGIA